MNQDAVAVAKVFSMYVRWALGEDRLAEVIRRNAEEANPHICHTHDFIDANEAMYTAMLNLGFAHEYDDSISYDQTDLMNAAWEIAKKADFDHERIGE